LRLGVALLAVAAGGARASDHGDGPAATADPAADLTDLYAWMSPDGAKLYLALDVLPNATAASRFSDAVLYTFHLASQASLADASQRRERLLVCRFTSDAPQQVSCWLQGEPPAVAEYVSGVAGAPDGLRSASGRMHVFAGLRDDPFFFNLDGFNAVAKDEKIASTTVGKDAAGCLLFDSPTSQLFLNTFKGDGKGGPGYDRYAAGAGRSGNVMAIVVAVDKALVTAGGPLVGVWASTNRPR
jgi:hypothetical protein